MTREKVFSTLATVRDLPTLPAVLQRLSQAINDPSSDARRIEAIMHDDPAMVTRILKVVNSAAYSTGREISTVHHAIVIMGLEAVRKVALMTSVFSTFKDGADGGFDREAFWRHSVCVGIAADVVYDRVRENMKTPIAKETLQLCGLLHDIGKIVFESCFRDEFAQARAFAVRDQKALWKAEREVFGTDHAEVGAWIAEQWKLSRDAAAVIRAHHEPENVDDEFIDLLRLCHAANHICNIEQLGDSGDVEASAFQPGVWKRLGLRVRNIQEIVHEVRMAADQSETLLAFVNDNS